MRDRRCTRDQQDVGRALQQPGERYLHWRRLQGRRGRVELRRLQRRKASQRKERHIGYASTRKVVDKSVVTSLRDVVHILDANNLRDCLRLIQLLGTDVAQTEMPNQSLTSELHKHRQRFFDRPLRWRHHSANPEIDQVQGVEPEIAEIVMNAIDQLLARKRVDPRFVRWPPGAQFGDQHLSIRIRMKRPLNYLVGHMRTVIIARIDVIDPRRDSLSQNSDGSVNIARWSIHARTGKLHGAIAHALQSY